MLKTLVHGLYFFLFRFTNRDWEKMNSIFKDKEGINFLNNYEAEDAWMAQLSGNSTSVWGISPPAKQKLIEELQSGRFLVFLSVDFFQL